MVQILLTSAVLAVTMIILIFWQYYPLYEYTVITDPTISWPLYCLSTSLAILIVSFIYVSAKYLTRTIKCYLMFNIKYNNIRKLLGEGYGPEMVDLDDQEVKAYLECGLIHVIKNTTVIEKNQRTGFIIMDPVVRFAALIQKLLMRKNSTDNV